MVVVLSLFTTVTVDAVTVDTVTVDTVVAFPVVFTSFTLSTIWVMFVSVRGFGVVVVVRGGTVVLDGFLVTLLGFVVVLDGLVTFLVGLVFFVVLLTVVLLTGLRVVPILTGLTVGLVGFWWGFAGAVTAGLGLVVVLEGFLVVGGFVVVVVVVNGVPLTRKNVCNFCGVVDGSVVLIGTVLVGIF